jgi:hypothetical protein
LIHANDPRALARSLIHRESPNRVILRRSRRIDKRVAVGSGTLFVIVPIHDADAVSNARH